MDPTRAFVVLHGRLPHPLAEDNGVVSQVSMEIVIRRNEADSVVLDRLLHKALEVRHPAADVSQHMHRTTHTHPHLQNAHGVNRPATTHRMSHCGPGVERSLALAASYTQQPQASFATARLAKQGFCRSVVGRR